MKQWIANWQANLRRHKLLFRGDNVSIHETGMVNASVYHWLIVILPPHPKNHHERLIAPVSGETAVGNGAVTVGEYEARR